MAGTEISVRASGSTDPGLGLVAAAFQEATGHRVKVTYDDKIVDDDGNDFDVVIASADALARDFRPTGKVEDGEVGIGRMGLGIAVRSDTEKADITSVEAFKRAVLDADAVLLTTHTSGLYFESILRKLGLYDRVAAKIERFPNGPALMDRLVDGRGSEFAVLSVNQVRRYEDRGLVMAGLLPEELQYYRDFVAVPMRSSRNKEVSWEFVRFCSGPGKPILIANGFV